MYKELTPLEALESLMEDYYQKCLDLGDNGEYYQKWNPRSERAIIEKHLKALEIIKKKQVDVYRFMTCEILATYNLHYAILRKNELRKYEYELLKEVLL